MFMCSGSQPLIAIFERSLHKQTNIGSLFVFFTVNIYHINIHTASSCTLEDMRTFILANYKCSCCQVTW